MKECVNVMHYTYKIDRDDVDPVFFAVVPDSFMTREMGSLAFSRLPPFSEGEDDEQDSPVMVPHDRWSF